MSAVLVPEVFFRDSLALVAEHPSVVRAKKVKQYQRMLGVADWHYEHCDSADAWRAGRDEFTKLYELQAEVDADGAIWRTVAPEGMAVPQPRVKVAQS